MTAHSKINMSSVFLILLLPFFFLSCGENTAPTGSENSRDDGSLVDGDWLIPKSQVIDGGPGKDGIASIDNPSNFSNVSEIDFIPDDRMITGVQIEGQIRAYPHQILDWHEIVNDKLEDTYFSLSYCPLTGTGMAWDRKLGGEVNEFGVSGLLFRNNLILYDRNTDSYWSQMQLRAVNGSFIERDIDTYQVVETSWETWKDLYPESDVLNANFGGITRAYFDGWAYGEEYLTSHGAINFPLYNFDNRLRNKIRVHGIIDMEPGVSHGAVKVYVIDGRNVEESEQYGEFGEGVNLIRDQVGRNEYLIAGSTNHNFSTSFMITDSEDELYFEAVQDQLPVIMKDNEGTYWDLFGNGVEGPRQGNRLQAARAYAGYWFAFAEFFPDVNIYVYK